MSTPPPRLRRIVIVLLYTLVFWVLLPAALICCGHAIDQSLALSSPPTGARVIGGIVAGVSVPLMLRAMLQLSIRGRGLPISHLPPADLVSSGTYARCRHPIYVAYNSSFVGLGIALGSWGVGAGAGALLLALWIAYAVLLEEPRLRARHGAAYGDYADSTPLIPRLFRRAAR